MKHIILSLLAFLFAIGLYSQEPTRCLTSNSYKIISNGKLTEIEGIATLCFNGNYFSFLTNESGLITFEIEKSTRKKYTSEGKLKDSFLSTESTLNERGFYSVDITHGDKIEVLINYPSVPNGYAILIASSSFIGGQENSSIQVNKNISAISIAESDTTANKKNKIATKDSIKKIEVKESPLTITEQPPKFVGGELKMYKYLQDNLIYPKDAKDEGLQGTSYVTFIVEKDGTISDAKILRGVSGCPLCDEEAMRLVMSMPKWNPAKQNGKDVRFQYNLPVKFKLK